MTQQEIINGNKLIAEFMGYKNLRSPKEYPLYKIPEHSYEINNEGSTELVDTFELNWDLCFHSSFDWLMPVVGKIEGLEYRGNEELDYWFLLKRNGVVGFWVDTWGDPYQIKEVKEYVFNNKDMTFINALYSACISFINWYNNQK